MVVHFFHARSKAKHGKARQGDECNVVCISTYMKMARSKDDCEFSRCTFYFSSITTSLPKLAGREKEKMHNSNKRNSFTICEGAAFIATTTNQPYSWPLRTLPTNLHDR